jgi:autoinducer 2-degrading protein
MFTVHVFIEINDKDIEAFKKLTEDNVVNSRKEDGIISFDFYQQQDDKTKFLLAESYQNSEAQLIHRETEHFIRWRAGISDMLVKPYSFIKYDKCL